MLSTLRHKGVAKKVLWAVTVVIILSFAIFGSAYRLDNSINSAGTIHGHSVSIKDFQTAYLDARDQAIMLYGDRFFKVGGQLNLEQEAWDRLILLREAKRQKVSVSDEDVAAFIAAVPFFQSAGHFDQFLYESIVKNPSVFDRNVHEFEEGVRGQMTIRKLFNTVTGPLSISEAELKKQYQLRNEKLKLNYVLFAPADYIKDVSATDDEVKKFYDERKDQFVLPTSLSLDYVQMTYAANATDADKAKVAKEAQVLADELKNNADFAAAAKAHKLEVKTSGLFTHDQPLLTFASSPEDVDKIFAMGLGQYSKPMEVPDGWQIVRIKEKKESYVPAFTEIKDQVKQALLTQKAFEVAKTKADAQIAAIRNGLKGKDFKTVAAGLGLKVQETPLFGRGEYIANMGLVAEFQQETLNLNKDNRLSTVVATSQGPAIIYLQDVQAITDDQFNAEKENFRQMLTAEKRNQLMVSFITKLRMDANVVSKVKEKMARR